MPMQDNGEPVLNPDGGMVRVYGKIAKQYKMEWEAFISSECHHTDVEVRERTVSGGSIRCQPQCLTCGVSRGNSVKKVLNLPKWDQELNNHYESERKQLRDDLCRKFIKLQEVENDKFDTKSEDWRKQYATYRRTAVWQSKRSLVIKRSNGICEGCLTEPATVVHHLDYSNIGDELLFQLVALCEPCHRKTHPEHHEPIFYDVDYIPCSQCRWGDDGITCGKFDTPAYQALSADGECGPSADGFEGFK